MNKLLILALARLPGVCAGADVTVSVIEGRGLVPIFTLARAEKLAASMFSEIGVRIRWERGKAAIATSGCRTSDETLIQVRIIEPFEGTEQRATLGTALPLAAGGTRVTIGYDHYLFDTRPGLLAHALAHEIAHVLQGIARHSSAGIMQAYWDPETCLEMERTLLSFSPRDAELILAGMGRQRAPRCRETLVASQ